MLRNFIFNLKNIIFFKFVICCLSISGILLLLNTLSKDYIESIKKNQNAEEALAEETLKLYSIINSRDKILETYSKYSKLLSTSLKKSCLDQIILVEKIDNLSKKYDLNQPITTFIKPKFLSGITSNTQSTKDSIKIMNYDVIIKFATNDYATLLTIIKEIYSYMPENTIVVSMEIIKQDVLDPKIIYKLSTEQRPDLIFVKLNIYIREITIIR